MTDDAESTGEIRPMCRGDLALVLAWRNHPDIRRYMYTTHVIAEPEHMAWYDRASQDDHKHLLIFQLAGIPMGFASLTTNAIANIADWGFYLAPNAKRGEGRKLGKAVLDYAFNTLSLHKVCGQALDFNTRSIDFHTRLGFTTEGKLREQHFDGAQHHSIVLFGMLRHEWNATL